MMGAGIAHANASRGIPCVLKDVSMEKARAGHEAVRKITAPLVAKGRMDEVKQAALLNLVTPTAEADDLKGCDLIIEAVFEQRALKAQVTREAEPMLAEGGVFASNTSTLPIGGLAEAIRSGVAEQVLTLLRAGDPAVELMCAWNLFDPRSHQAYRSALSSHGIMTPAPVQVRQRWPRLTLTPSVIDGNARQIVWPKRRMLVLHREAHTMAGYGLGFNQRVARRPCRRREPDGGPAAGRHTWSPVRGHRSAWRYSRSCPCRDSVRGRRAPHGRSAR